MNCKSKHKNSSLKYIEIYKSQSLLEEIKIKEGTKRSNTSITGIDSLFYLWSEYVCVFFLVFVFTFD